MLGTVGRTLEGYHCRNSAFQRLCGKISLVQPWSRPDSQRTATSFAPTGWARNFTGRKPPDRRCHRSKNQCQIAVVGTCAQRFGYSRKEIHVWTHCGTTYRPLFHKQTRHTLGRFLVRASWAVLHVGGVANSSETYSRGRGGTNRDSDTIAHSTPSREPVSFNPCLRLCLLAKIGPIDDIPGPLGSH